MPITAKELREKRAVVAKQIQVLADRSNDEKHDWTAEDQAEWLGCNTDYDGQSEQIERVERAEAVQLEQTSPIEKPGRDDRDGGKPDGGLDPDSEETRGLALQAWFRAQSGEDLTDKQQEACTLTGLNPNRRNLDISLARSHDVAKLQREMRSQHPQRRDLSAVDGGSGGYTVPTDFINQLEINMLAFGPMLVEGEIMRTDGGGELPWPTADDTGNTGEQVGEQGTIGTSVDPTFGQVLFGAHKFSSKLIKVPSELLDDSAFNLAQIIGGWIGERLGRIQNTKYTTGSGAATPYGIMNSASIGVTAASATAIVSDEIIDLEHSVDPAYRDQNAVYMFHDNILLVLRKLKDSQNRYLFQSNLREGGPDTINGRRFAVNQAMSSTVAADDRTMIFGNLKKYKIRQVKTLRLRRLVERYADNDQEGFIGFQRADGNLLDAGTAPVKYLQQAP